MDKRFIDWKGQKNEVSEFGMDTFVRKAIRQKNSSIDAQ